jgi:putative transposase
MIRQKEEGWTNRKIARVYDITPRRLQQLWAEYRSTGHMPTLNKPGRPRKPPDPVEEQLVVEMYEKHHVCAVILEHLIKKEHDKRVPHNRIHRYLVKHGYAAKNPKKQRRRRWVRYERKHSMSLWHMDWFQVEKLDPKIGKWLVAVQDDASRRIMGYDVYQHCTAKNSVEVLKQAIARHGLPDSVITDKGTQFYAVDARGKKKGYNEFEKFLQKHGITHILARTNHPQTNSRGMKRRLSLLRAGGAVGGLAL